MERLQCNRIERNQGLVGIIMEIKHCIYCKSNEVKLDSFRDDTTKRIDYYVYCLNCSSQGPLVPNQETAIRFWNKPSR